MTSSERRRCMRLLRCAQNGEEGAHEELVKSLAFHFKYMIWEYHSVDPAYDGDDLVVQFQLGIWQAIPKVDERGDPLFHLAWRGQRAVCALLRVIKQRRSGTAEWVRDFGTERSIGTLPEGWDPPDPHPDSDLEYVVQMRETRNEAHERVVRILANVSLSERQQDVLAWMLTEPELEEKGANQRLARHLGVSEQAASVLRRRVMGKLAAVETG